jgi:2-C-methyl-D-erythritol 2,4-cyclodiphosphate synthase
VCGELSKQRFAIGNIDATIIAEKPKIYPQLAAMKSALAKSTHVPVSNIGLKATTNEGVGDLGRGLAIAAHAVVLIAKA